MNKVEKTVRIENKLGLHARAATKLAKLCQNYQASISLEIEGKQASADSIMGLMLLTGSQGKQVNIIADGDDANPAMIAICELFSNKFDEGE